ASRQAPAIRQTAGGQGPALALQGEVAKPTGDSPDVWRGGAARVREAVPSAETLIHQAIYRAAPAAGAVFHVHPVYATLISSFYGHPRERRMLKVEWFEMM